MSSSGNGSDELHSSGILSRVQPALQITLPPTHKAGGQFDLGRKLPALYPAVNRRPAQPRQVHNLPLPQNAINRHVFSFLNDLSQPSRTCLNSGSRVGLSSKESSTKALRRGQSY